MMKRNKSSGRNLAISMSVTTVTVDLWMDGVTRSGDYCVESVMFIGCVMDGTDGAVGFGQRVGTFDDVAIADFFLVLVIPSMAVGYSVFEFVFRIGLKIIQKRITTIATKIKILFYC